MTFPDDKFADIAGYCDAYFDRSARAAASVDRAALARAAETLLAAYEAGAMVYVCGNGGSAAISNHMICDHLKGTQTDSDLKPRVVSLSATIETMTAIANDISYDEIFVYQLRTLAKPGDVLVTISSSGDSENVVRACQWARENDVRTIAMTAFDGGRTRDLAEINLHVEADNYGVAEDTHQALMHILSQYLRQARMSEDLIGRRKF